MLRQLMLARKQKGLQDSLAELLEVETNLMTREEELEEAIGQAETDEELEAVEESVKELEEDKAKLAEKKDKLESEIAEIEAELDEIKSKEPENKTRSEGDEKMETRVVNHEYFTRDVEDFYQELRRRLQVRNAGQVLPPGESGAELIIPDIVVNRIRERIGDYTTLYPLVDLVTAGGRVKLILDVDASEATWVEMRGAIPEEDDTDFTAVEFDGFKVGRVVYVDNSLLEDSIINLDDYLTKRIARSIAKALDKAILVGTGSGDKQPFGIIPMIPEDNKVSAPADYKALIPYLGLIDTGEDASGEIVCVVHRQTYYAKLAALSLHTDASGRDVVMLPNLAKPNFLGLRVEFSNYMPKDHLLFGVFDKYTLVEREGTRIDMSGHYKFREDQTAVRGIGRYDGKPVMPEAFVIVELENEIVEPEENEGGNE